MRDGATRLHINTPFRRAVRLNDAACFPLCSRGVPVYRRGGPQCSRFVHVHNVAMTDAIAEQVVRAHQSVYILLHYPRARHVFFLFPSWRSSLRCRAPPWSRMATSCCVQQNHSIAMRTRTAVHNPCMQWRAQKQAQVQMNAPVSQLPGSRHLARHLVPRVNHTHYHRRCSE